MSHPAFASRRDFVRGAAALAVAGAPAARWLEAQQPIHANLIESFRAAAARTPIKVTALAPHLYLLQGVGGNMVALTGPDGTLLVDTSVQTAAPHIAEALTSLQAPPIRLLINTHWHFDHTDGNAALRSAGAHEIFAHENTLKRLSAPQYLEALDVHFPAVAPEGRPTRTFTDSSTLTGNGQTVILQHFAPAHTDSDLYVWFPESNVLHVADTWFNGFYPLIDYSSGGSLPGMIAAADRSLVLSNTQTKIIPGHGPLGDRATLRSYRDMLATVHDRVATLKASGKSLPDVLAAQPTADLDSAWGKGSLTPDQFVTLAYKTS